MAQKDYRKELAETAAKIGAPGKGILAADESTGTIGKKFVTINVENTEENRRKYRELLFTTEGWEKHCSGVIFFDEQTKQSTKDGKKFIDLLTEKGVLSGIKVDCGVQPLAGANEGETWTAGLDDLAKRCAHYYSIGCRFAKWRAVLKIDEKTNCPTDQAIQENAWGLARYAMICQANGLVPIVEPEILADGTHSIEVSQKVTERVLAACVKALQDNNIFWEGCLLKPNMVTPGLSFPDRAKVTSKEIAARTVLALSRTMPPALAGVVFLSGGQSEEEASVNLNSMNTLTDVRRPWFLTFSYGRALQNSAVKTWKGLDENWKAAQEAFLTRAKANSEAQLGIYKGSKDANANESLVIENYKY